MRRDEIQRLIAQAKARKAAQERFYSNHSFTVGNVPADFVVPAVSEQPGDHILEHQKQQTRKFALNFGFLQPVLVVILAIAALGIIHLAPVTGNQAQSASNQVSFGSFLPTSWFKNIYGDLASSFNFSIYGKDTVPVTFVMGDEQQQLEAELLSDNHTNHLIVDPGNVSLDFQNIKEKPSQVAIYVSPKTNNNDIKTNVVYVAPGVSFEQTKVTLAKKFTDKVNAILTCSDQDYNKDTGECDKPWQIADATPHDNGTSVTFTTKHFSAVAGAYLNIIDKVNDETVGITWKEHFQTYGTSTLTIKTVQGAHFGTDLGFQGIFCGNNEVTAQHPDQDTYTIENYSCDNQVSSINNLEQTGGIHWLSFTFGDSVDQRVHNFACDSGTLNDTCTVSTVQAITNGTTLSGTGNMTIANGGKLTTSVGQSFTINISGTLDVQDGGQINGNVTITAGTVTVDANVANGGGKIIVDSLGNAGGTSGAGSGTGGGGAAGSGTGMGGSGGAYGGDGGSGCTCGAGIATGPGGTSYGSAIQPTSFGSGGGAGDGGGIGGAGGAGAGTIKITATGTVTDNGTISANGAAGANGVGGGGGGSGGSVWITADTIAGSGILTANGGNGGNWITQTSEGGSGGGGGRIALYYTTAFTHSGTESAFGGSAGTSTTGCGCNGNSAGAGTIYKKAASAANGDLIVDNNSVSGANTTQTAATTYTFDNITIKNSAKYVVPSGDTLNMVTSYGVVGSGTTFTNSGTISLPATVTLVSTAFAQGTVSSSSGTTLTIGTGTTFTLSGTSTFSLANLTIQSGGTLTHASNGGSRSNVIDLSVSGNVDVQTGGSISADSKGYSGGSASSGGNGAGGGSGQVGGQGGGGGYGGNGGTGGVSGGNTYGSVTQPTDIGSGGGAGGNSVGGQGGGAIKIIATGTISVNGTVSANGGSNVCVSGFCPGGGAGGSIWLNGSTISGTGSITANGGTAPGTAGGGAGGRIALYYTTLTHSGTESAYGSATAGNQKGGAGTIYKKQLSATNGDLIVDNNALSGANTTQSSSTLLTFDNVTIKNTAAYIVPTGDTLGVATAFTNGTTNSSLTVNSGGTLSTAAAVTSLAGAPVVTMNGTFTPSATSLTIPVTFTFASAATLTGASSIDLTIGSGITATWNASTLTLKSLTVSGTLVGNLTITTTGNITVALGGNIDANNLGSGGGGFSGNGGGTGGGTGQVAGYGGGGGYGGHGGAGANGAAGGVTYGSNVQPISAGSGGGAGGNSTGGAGGGVLKITSAGTITVNGSIQSNGQAGVTNGGFTHGGGSGGSVWLTANTIAGSGSINANGGNGSTGNATAGGGGGGRIALYYVNSFTYSGTQTTSGGTGFVAGSTGTTYTEAGSTAAITAFCFVVANGCTVAGRGASPQQAYKVHSIAGTSTPGTNATVASVQISIKDTDASVNKWYNTSNNSFDQASENFFTVTGTTSWSYDPSAIQWVVGHTYQVDVQAISTNSLTGPVSSLSFTYNTSPPTIANITAAQSGNNVNITYDVSDPVFTTFTVSVGFDAGITLGADITSSANSLIVSDATHLPASGSIYIDDEEISYSSKASNTLSGLTRAQNSTTAAAHTSGTIVYIKATTVSGAAGASVAAGTGKTITWTAATDVPSYTTSSAKVKVIANNLNSTNQVGSAVSPAFAYDTTAPATQQSSSVKAVPTSESAVTVTWTTDKASSSTVDYGTTLSYGLTTTDATLVTSHTVNLTGLAASTTYFFRVKSIDANNNILIDDNGGVGYSVKTPDIIPGRTIEATDTTPPTITNVAVGTITANGVTITWTTDEVANSFIYYGGTTAYGSLAGSPDVFVTDHSVSVSGLTPSTTYNYQVVSLDKSGNRTGTANATFTTTAPDGTGGSSTTGGAATGTGTGTSTDLATDLQNQINNLQSQQQAEQQLISQLQDQLSGGLDADQVNAIKAELSNLREELIATNGKLQAAQQQLQQYQNLAQENQTLKDSNQKLQDQLSFITNKILGLKDGDTLSPQDLLKVLVARFQALAVTFKTDATIQQSPDLNNTLADANTTLKDLTQFAPGPKILVKPTVELASNQATISWTTDQAATGSVSYADDNAFSSVGGKYSATASENSASTDHKVVLDNLLPSTIYHYQITAAFDSGASTSSNDFTFTTKTELPVISSARIEKLSDTSAKVSWSTSVPTNSAVIYVEVINGTADTANSKTVGAPQLATTHSVELDGLLQGQTYDIQISSSDAYNNVVTQKLGNFVTGQDITPPNITDLRPQISIIPDPKQSTIQAIITWKTDEPATTQVVFAKGQPTDEKFNDQSELNPEYTYSHTVVITNWDQGSLYSFKAVSKDQSGNEARSKTYTVRTPQQQGTVIDVIVNNFSDVFGWTKKIGQ